MKAFLCIAMITTSLVACGNNKTNPSAQGVIKRQQRNVGTEETQMASVNGVEETQHVSGSNILIAYFTVPETDGVDAVAGASRVVKKNEVYGNTQYIADEILERIVSNEAENDSENNCRYSYDRGITASDGVFADRRGCA